MCKVHCWLTEAEDVLGEFLTANSKFFPSMSPSEMIFIIKSKVFLSAIRARKRLHFVALKWTEEKTRNKSYSLRGVGGGGDHENDIFEQILSWAASPPFALTLSLSLWDSIWRSWQSAFHVPIGHHVMSSLNSTFSCIFMWSKFLGMNIFWFA